MPKPAPVLSPALSCLEGIRHGFFTRQGGVSQDIYQSLNIGIGSDDTPALVQENRRRVAAFFDAPLDHLISVYQVHSPDVVAVQSPFSCERPHADAMVTNQKGLVLGISTADCGPVLFADQKAGIIGAAHAGWRGALSGVVESTVEAMEKLGGHRQDIVAVLGPCIGPENYEVTAEFRATFLNQQAAYHEFFSAGSDSDHFLFDLWSFIIGRLQQAGVAASCVRLCTYADEERFFSYRRKTHRGESDYGRQISAICLEDIA